MFLLFLLPPIHLQMYFKLQPTSTPLKCLRLITHLLQIRRLGASWRLCFGWLVFFSDSKTFSKTPLLTCFLLCILFLLVLECYSLVSVIKRYHKHIDTGNYFFFLKIHIYNAYMQCCISVEFQPDFFFAFNEYLIY